VEGTHKQTLMVIRGSFSVDDVDVGYGNSGNCVVVVFFEVALVVFTIEEKVLYDLKSYRQQAWMHRSILIR
jgi:hypothetical protein